MNDLLISFGAEVKAINNSGKVGGYLVRFSTAQDPDISSARDFFTKSTDFDLERDNKVTVYYDHGLDDTLKKRKLGQGEMKLDDVGVWVEAQLNMRDEYEKQIFEMAQNGKLGWSSGTANHLVTRKKVDDANEILCWPLGLDASLTPTPAEPRNNALSLKSVMTLADYTNRRQAKMGKQNRKGLFEDNLAEGLAVWDLVSALMASLEDIAEAVDANEDLSQTFDAQPQIAAVMDEFNVRLGQWAARYVERCCGDQGSPYMLSLAASKKSLDRLKGKLENDLPIEQHTQIAETAAEGFAQHAQALGNVVRAISDRWKQRNEARIKSGRMISASNKARIDAACNTMKDCANSILSCHDEMRGLIADPVDDTDNMAGALSTKAVDVNLQAEAEHLAFQLQLQALKGLPNVN